MIATLAMMTLAACSTVSLEAGKDLAAAGQTAAAALRADTAAAASDYALNANRTALQRVLERAENPTLTISPPMVTADIAAVSAALGARATMLEKLGDLYSSLGEGMKASAAEDTKNAFNSFLLSVDGYRAAVGGLPQGMPLAERPEAQGIGLLFGKFAAAIQQKKMKRASEVVRGELERVREALQKEAQLTVSARRVNFIHRQTLAEALLRSGLADPLPRFQEFADLSGQQVGPDAAKAYQNNQRLREALTAYRTWENDHKLAAIEASYSKSLRVFDSLVKQHEKFEAGKPFTFAQLLTELEELKAITLLLKGGQ